MDGDVEGDGVFEALVAVNRRWLGRYARLHPNFSVELSLLERNSLWMNSFFQKSRMITSAASPQAKNIMKKHRETIVERLRSAPLPHSESPFSTNVVDPMAALLYAASADRCPHNNMEDLLAEAWELLQCTSIREHALRSGFGGCVFRFLIEFTETQKRIACLRLLVLLAEENSSVVVNSCKIAAQGHFWQPNMFVLSLQKRHHDNSTLCELAARLLECFSQEMPISPPIVLNQTFEGDRQRDTGFRGETSPLRLATSPLRGSDGGSALPLLLNGCHRVQSPYRPFFSPTTTISTLYQEAPSPYSPMKLPLARPPTSPLKQSQRAKIFSMPKLGAVDGQRYRCNTPNAPHSRIERSMDIEANRTLEPLFGSPPQSPSVNSLSNSRVIVSEKYSWNPECINSVSGFEWWWRSLPQNHTNLEPIQKLKMVTKAAVRLHSKGELQRAIELYVLALSSVGNDEVSFRLRINLACAYEAAEDLVSSIGEFRLALELNPHDLYAIYKLGCVLTLVGELEEARMHFESIVNDYPQAVDALKNLEKVVAVHQQQQELRKAAIARAKERRSPLKMVSPRSMTLREPAIPSTPVVQAPAPHRKRIPASERVEVAPKCENGDAIVTEVYKTETATIATLTDNHILTPNLLELLVRRCQKARIDMLEVLQQLDPQQHGLIHWESFVKLVQVITGVCDLDDDVRMTLCISPADRVSIDNQVFLKYKVFLDAYTEQHQVEAALLSSGNVVQLKQLIDDLIRHDMTHFSHHSVSEWVRSGSERAATKLNKRSSSSVELTSCETEASDAHELSTLEGSCSAPNLLEHKQEIITPRTRVRKDRAREEWLLTAEKARVLARRQQHCMKSLCDIATRARAHIISRRKAMAFLVMVAQNAQEELRVRKLRCLTARQDEAAEIYNDSVDESDNATAPLATSETIDTSDEVDLSAVKVLSEDIYDDSVRIAMSRLHPNTGFDDLKAVAARFAEFCQVPFDLLKTEEATLVD